NFPQNVRQFGAGHDAVLRAIAGAQAANRSERLLAALPELQSFFFILGEPHFPRATPLADFNDLVALLIQARFKAINFDKQDSLSVERKAELKRRFDGYQNPLIHHFQGSGDNAGADNLADSRRRVIDRLEYAEHRAMTLRVFGKPHPDLGDDRQRAL